MNRPMCALLCAWFCVSPSAVFPADQHYEVEIFHCLEMNPSNCSSTTLPLATLPANPSAAYAQAQAMVAAWIAERPGLTLRGFDMRIGRGA